MNVIPFDVYSPGYGVSKHWERNLFRKMVGINYLSAIISLYLTTGVVPGLFGQEVSLTGSQNVTILDTTHYSHVMADTRKYRVFFPPGYKANSEERYPVIYFFHGWAQRYFGEIGVGYSHYDEGDDNGGDNMEAFVKKRDVIIVKIDGSNQFPSEALDLTPYNIGTVKSFRQFPIYFEELVKHVDKSYRTIPDRRHRAVSGLSMGGFMTFWVSGKYPHLVSGAGNFCGSPEFTIGPYEFPVEYNHNHMYDNYEGVNVRFHWGSSDKLRYYHQDLNKIWPQVIDNYEYQIYEASHITCGMGDMFEFLYQTFTNPLPDPENWHHIDVYPNFDIWGYEVTSDRNRPGFTVLKNVNERGFRSAVRNLLPKGELMSDVNLNIKTPPVYDSHSTYYISDYNEFTGVSTIDTVHAGPDGRIHIALDGNVHHVGINKANERANMALLSAQTTNIPWLQANKEVELSVKLLNKGLTDAQGLDMELSASRDHVDIIKNFSTLAKVGSGEVVEQENAFTVSVTSDTVEIVRFLLTIEDQSGNQWTDHFDMKVRNDEDNLNGELVVADGKMLTVVSEAVDSVTEMIGVGNGDGIPNPGESIVILIKNQGKLYRTSAFTSSQYVNPNGIYLQTSDSWQNYEHIGASTKFTTPVIASDCPDGEELDFWLEYWVPNLPEHIIKRGTASIRVEGSRDETAPVFKWMEVRNDRKMVVAAYDPSGIKLVKVRMIPDEEASQIRYINWDKPEGFEIVLGDKGESGDNFAGDSIFSASITNRANYYYKTEIQITDFEDNTLIYNHETPIFIQDLK